MSYRQKLGIVSLLPKGSKDREYVKNWRPITLLNVFYKIGASCIASRLKKILPFLINESQKGFMSGRFIGENIRILYIPGLLLLIYFEKAFDSLSHEFIMQTSIFFFGESFKQWIKVLYDNAFSCIRVNGHITERFDIGRGCRQGDPLSPYIFLICSEILGLLIRKNQSIVGLKVKTTENKIFQYADDTLLTLNGSEKDLEESLKVLEEYAGISGLKVNKEKTSVIWIGSFKNRKDKIHGGENLHWTFNENFRYLGIDFWNNLKEMVEHNYDRKIKEIKSR